MFFFSSSLIRYWKQNERILLLLCNKTVQIIRVECYIFERSPSWLRFFFFWNFNMFYKNWEKIFIISMNAIAWNWKQWIRFRIFIAHFLFFYWIGLFQLCEILFFFFEHFNHWLYVQTKVFLVWIWIFGLEIKKKKTKWNGAQRYKIETASVSLWTVCHLSRFIVESKMKRKNSLINKQLLHFDLSKSSFSLIIRCKCVIFYVWY